jgi:peptidoglycan/xylan/chitin deacetylase (PgdA/CDA1 family)
MRPRLNKRDIAAALLGSGLTGIIARGPRKAIRILAYHRVLDESTSDFLFDDGVISATTQAFYNQMNYVRRNFDVISFQDLHAIESEGKALPDRPLIITFDDGYRDNYTNAFPVFKEFRIPATVFVEIGHTRLRSLYWWDLIAYCFKTTARTGIILDQISADLLPLRTARDRRSAIEHVLRWIKRVPERTKAQFIEDLPGALGVSITSGLADGMHLSWGEIREMADCGIEFGSHTVTHPVLSNVDDARLEREVFDSKTALERQLHKEVIVFSYPVGGKGNFDSRARAAVARAGYKYAVSYVDGVAGRVGIDRYALPRIHVEADHSLNLFRANLSFPSLMLGRAAL